MLCTGIAVLYDYQMRHGSLTGLGKAKLTPEKYTLPTESSINPKQIASSYKLTLWLMQRLHVQLRNVIGHNESLISPYHKELYVSWRCQTHSDFIRRDMQTYRGLLKQRARAAGVPIGPCAASTPMTRIGR